LLDVMTIMVLIYALGGQASISGVFMSFMISNLFRTISIIPGGLGTFEATSVLTLKMAGLDVPTSISATLLFRGLSFWLPMAPGFWLARNMMGSRARGPGGEAGAYWSMSADAAMQQTATSSNGLTATEAARRLRARGPNALKEHRRMTRLDAL